MNAPERLDPLVTKTCYLDGSDPEKKREEIRRYFHQTFSLYESLFDCLACDDAYYTKATPLRHPLIFYYGHTAVFFINKLHVAKLIPERLDPRIESMLAIGVDEMSWDDLNDAHYDWPTPAEVSDYRNKTRDIVDDLISSVQITLPIVIPFRRTCDPNIRRFFLRRFVRATCLSLLGWAAGVLRLTT